MGSLTPEARISRLVITAAAMFLILRFLSLFRSRPDAWTTPELKKPISSRNTTQQQSLPPRYLGPFPHKLWQTGKTGFVNLEQDARDTIMSWLKMNQNWRYELLTDHSAETYVRTTFANRPEIIELYFDIGDPILRADMLRYLILLGDGGVYSDVDTKALKPISNWIPLAYIDYVNVVVGVEYDRLDGERWFDWTLDLQFTNWAMMSKPGHPALELTVSMLSDAINKMATAKDTDVSHLTLSQHEILNCTGPALFTMAIFRHLSEATGEEFSWLNVTKLSRPMLVEDVLILPINGFGNSQPHSNSRSENEDDAFVKHLFKGSWKKDRPVKSKEADDEERRREEEHWKLWDEQEKAREAEEKEKKKKQEAADKENQELAKLAEERKKKEEKEAEQRKKDDDQKQKEDEEKKNQEERKKEEEKKEGSNEAGTREDREKEVAQVEMWYEKILNEDSRKPRGGPH